MPPRRSGRLGGTARYADDPLKAAEISRSSSSEADVGANNWKGKRRASQKDSSDENFAGVVGHGEEELMVMDDDHSEDEEDEASRAEVDASSNDEEMSLISSRPGYKAAKSLPSRHAREDKKVVQVSNSGGMRNRGTPNPTEHVSKSKHLQITFGTDERDLTAVIYARDRWCRGIDSGLPTRMSLNLPSYGAGEAFGVDPEEIEMEATQGWDWYYNDQIGGDFRRRQRTESIQKGEARKYLPLQNPGKRKVIIGPVNDQKAYELGQDDILNFGDAWDTINSRIKKDKKSSHEHTLGQHSSTMKKVDGSASTSETQEKKVREGWILNLGNKVQCLAWAPNQDSLVQYLAVAVVISVQQKEEFRVSGKLKGAPAFTPSDPYPAALQIWSFKARDSEMYTKSLDMAVEPKLRLVLCTDWGDLRRISWCPVARTPREEDEPKRLGLLAGIWGDGSLKILDVTVDGDSGATEYYKVTSAAFSCRPPSTVCTCLTWLSPSDIAVGCANGFVAIWNIASPATEIEPRPIPYFYMQLHSTYILNISSAYPQHPHLLGTTSMDGQTRLTSILDPQKDTVDTVRMRMGSMQMSYSPVLQAFFSHDENDFVRLLAIRRFYSTTTVARLPSTVSTLAPCSFWHPSALFGCTGGTVIAVNPLRRLLHSREKNWHLIWFTHEWIRNEEENGVCVSRFLDGHRAESVGLMRNMVTDRRRLVNGSLIVTIHEEGTHITTLAWNPNQQCAGWASAGMGCGLVRVEDLAM